MTTNTRAHDHEDHGSIDPQQDLAAFWEDRYAGAEPIWSGRVNATLADVVGGLVPGRVLDLGCGEGGDVLWLAEGGWQVTGVDVSTIAIARARAAVQAAGIEPDRIVLVAHDLAHWQPDGTYDLVTASFFHSPVDFPRTQVLRRAADRLVVGGHLLLVSHAAFPPWADAAAHGDHRFLTPAEELAELALDPACWEPVVVETRQRDAVGPDGQQAVLDDGVLLVRRTA